MVPLGLGMATTIRVGFNVGAGDSAAARRAGWIAMATSAGFAFLSILLLLTLGPWLIGLYTEQTEVITIASGLLGIVACFLIFDGVQVNAMGALRGFKDTAVPFGIAFTCYWLLGFPIAWALGYGYFEHIDLGVYGYWLGLAAGLVFSSSLRWVIVFTGCLSLRRHPCERMGIAHSCRCLSAKFAFAPAAPVDR